MHLHYNTLMEWDSCRVAILTIRESMYLARDPTLDCVIHQHVGEPTHLTLSTAGMYAGNLFATWATTSANLLAEYYYVVVERY